MGLNDKLRAKGWPGPGPHLHHAGLIVSEQKLTGILKPVVGRGKVGRNDPCKCGSGRKAKRCCGTIR